MKILFNLLIIAYIGGAILLSRLVFIVYWRHSPAYQTWTTAQALEALKSMLASPFGLCVAPDPGTNYVACWGILKAGAPAFSGAVTEAAGAGIVGGLVISTIIFAVMVKKLFRKSVVRERAKYS